MHFHILLQSYFEQINDKPLRDMLLATQALQNCVQPNEYDGIVKSAENLKARWIVRIIPKTLYYILSHSCSFTVSEIQLFILFSNRK